MTIFICFTLLFVKHFICDFPLQGPYQYHNKGDYGHPGGILHSTIQVIGTFAALVMFVPSISSLFWVCMAEFLIHYNVDWAKMNLNRVLNWKPDTHEEFWWLLGFDQLLHYLTYSGIIYVLFLM